MTAIADDHALTATAVAGAPLTDVLRWLDTSVDGLSSEAAATRLARVGPNSLRTHRVSAWAVLRRQLNNAVLALLAVTAVVSFFLGDPTQAIIIGIILVVSIGLGFLNEYRAERASAALHSSVHHNAVVRRDGRFVKIDVNGLVPGDVIALTLGELVPADVRLITANGLECNESILTGESTAAEKSEAPAPPDEPEPAFRTIAAGRNGSSAGCPVHRVPWRQVPAGISKRSGRAYQAFLACPEPGCDERPPMTRRTAS